MRQISERLTNVSPDIEAQELGDSVVVPRQKLKELVQMLAYSVSILQNDIELDENLHAKCPNKHGFTHSAKNDQSGRCSQPCPHGIMENRFQDGDAEEECLYGALEDEDASEQGAFSSEEFASRKAADLKAFESFMVPHGVGDSSTIDPWRSLHFIVGQQLTSISTIHTLVSSVSGRYLVPRILQYYSENPEVRMDIQRELFYGLSRWWWTHGKRLRPWPRAREPGPLDMGPWIAIIGMRLPTYPHNILADGSQDVTCLNILLLLLHHCQSAGTMGALKDLGGREGVFWADKLTVREVLTECYRHKILNRPERGDWREYQQQLQTLIRTLELINLWHPVQTYSPFSHVHVVEKILGTKLSKLWQSTWLEVDNQVYPPSTNDSFPCRDMSLELLRKVGKLKIQWTEYITEHLQLDIESSTLKIFWFGFTAMANPIFHLGCGDLKIQCNHTNHSSRVRIFDEIGATYSLLFRSQRDTGRDNRAQYGQLPIPEWLRVFHGDDRGLLPARQASDMSYFLDEDKPRASDIEYHLLRAHKKLPVSQRFERYEIWGDRLRQLKAYMDSQKPGGIRGLWADKRDSLQWYTFWAVIIVGGASVMLSVLGLMVAIVQTVGTFKGLE